VCVTSSTLKQAINWKIKEISASAQKMLEETQEMVQELSEQKKKDQS
jgi:hypothetical protein